MRALRHQHVEQLAVRADMPRFYFLAETGLRLDYTRRYGRAPGSQRVSGAVPLRRGRSLTLSGARGVCGPTAVQVLEGALNHRSVAFYVSRVLGPQLRRGDVLVLDNLAVHKLARWAAGRTGRPRRRGAISTALFARCYARRAGLEQAQSQAATGPGSHPLVLVQIHDGPPVGRHRQDGLSI